MLRQVKIIKGPAKFELSTRLVDGNNKEQKPVTFTVNDGTQTWEENVKLDMLQREDGSGESWNLEGYNTANFARVKIYYSSGGCREGLMTFIPKDSAAKQVKSDWDKFIDELKSRSGYVVEFPDIAESILLHTPCGTAVSGAVQPLLMTLKQGIPHHLYYRASGSTMRTAGFFNGKWCDHAD